MKLFKFISALALVAGVAVSIPAYGQDRQVLIVSASNAVPNNLLVYNRFGQLLQTLPTGGKGGVAGNAGGIAVSRDLIAVVNFGSDNVSIFEPSTLGLHLKQIIPTEPGPVSVAFGHSHLYVLGSTEVESHPVSELGVSTAADGLAGLVKADGSAAQVGVLSNQLIISEKSNAIETVNINWEGRIEGTASLVQNIPTNVNAPFGLATRDNEAYVTIAHANEISLVRNDTVLTVTGSGTQSAPCWVTLDGPYLFSANSPSKSVSRYAVYGKQIVQDAAVVATFNGNPTDIAYSAGRVAVIDGNGTVSHLSIFDVDGDGNFTVQSVATMPSGANGVAIFRDED